MCIYTSFAHRGVTHSSLTNQITLQALRDVLLCFEVELTVKVLLRVLAVCSCMLRGLGRGDPTANLPLCETLLPAVRVVSLSAVYLHDDLMSSHVNALFLVVHTGHSGLSSFINRLLFGACMHAMTQFTFVQIFFGGGGGGGVGGGEWQRVGREEGVGGGDGVGMERRREVGDGMRGDEGVGDRKGGSV